MESKPETEARMRRRRRAALAVCGLGALALVVVALVLPSEAWTRARELAGAATEWVRGLGAGWFFAAFAVLPAVGFPVSPFALGAGSLFGPVLGLPTVLALAGLSMAVSMSLSYVLAAFLLRPWVTRMLEFLGYRVPVVPAGKQRMFVFLVRITPGAPYVFQSFLIGLSGVPFRVYLIVSWLVATSTVSLMIVFGDALIKGHGKVALAALSGVVLFVVAVKVIRGRIAAREGAALVARAGAEGSGGDGV